MLDSQRIEDLERQVAELQDRHDALRQHHDSLRNRRSVRVLTSVLDRLGAVVRARRRRVDQNQPTIDGDLDAALREDAAPSQPERPALAPALEVEPSSLRQPVAVVVDGRAGPALIRETVDSIERHVEPSGPWFVVGDAPPDLASRWTVLVELPAGPKVDGLPMLLLEAGTRVGRRTLRRMLEVATARADAAAVVAQSVPIQRTAGRTVAHAEVERAAARTGDEFAVGVPDAGVCVLVPPAARADVPEFDGSSAWFGRAVERGWNLLGTRRAVCFHSIGDSSDQSWLGHLDERTERFLPRVLYVLHEGIGGTVATTADLAAALAGRHETYVLTSTSTAVKLYRISADGDEKLRELQISPPLRITDEAHPAYDRFVISVLLDLDIDCVHIRQLINHPLSLPGIAADLSIPVVLSVHDGYLVCPTVHLLDESDSYCAGVCTPGQGSCRVSSPWSAHAPSLKHGWINEWRRRVAAMLEHVAQVITTSPTTARLMESAYPMLSEVLIVEHGRDLTFVPPVTRPAGERLRVLVPGNLDVHKGSALIASIAELDAGRRLEFVFAGRVPEDLAAIGRLHGPYTRDEFASVVESVSPDVVGVFAIWPETYSHVLTEAWAAGRPVVVTDLGAPAERVRSHGGGWVIPRGAAEAYEALVRIADDRVALRRVAEEISASWVRTGNEMAADYDAVYRRLGCGGVLRVGMVLVEAYGLHPPSVHVRTLTRVLHPDAVEVSAWPVDPHRFVQGVSGDDLDIVLVQRTAVPPDLVEPFVETARKKGVPLWFDLDDDLFSAAVEPEFAAHRRSLLHLIDAAALVTVSTEVLAGRIRDVSGRNATVLQNRLDELLWFGGARPAARDSSTLVRVLYQGYRRHSEDLALLEPVFRDLADVCRLSVIGVTEDDEGADWYTRVPVPHDAQSYPRYVAWLRSMAHTFDMAVAPLVDTELNRSKSDLKFLEYAALELPGVYSAVGPYAELGGRGHVALTTANTTAGWLEAVQMLARDPKRRREIADAAHAYVTGVRLMGESIPDLVEMCKAVVRE